MKYRCLRVNDKYTKKLFLKLPKMLYEKRRLPQDKKREEQLLSGKHCLSSHFEITAFVVIDASGQPVCRAALTMYRQEEAAFVGLFESADSAEACGVLFGTLEQEAKAAGRSRLVGPFDASFWLRYRCKMNAFKEPYTGEPYNPEYYPALWKAMGFEIKEHYYSNQLRVPDSDNEKHRNRLELMKEKGVEFYTSSYKTFPEDIRRIYYMLIKLYAGFPEYRAVWEEEFITMFSSLRYVLDFDMVYLARHEGKTVGFFIAIPNYGNLTNRLSFINLLKILKIRMRPKEYIIPYVGADAAYPGLGTALAELMKEKLKEKGCTSVAALIHDGKATGNYYKELTVEKYEYALMEKLL